MAALLFWLLFIELIGLLAFPLAYRVFSRLPDRGWTFTKPLALVLVSYGVWLVGLSHTIPNSRWSVLLVLVIMAALSWAAGRDRWAEVGAFLRREARTIALAEALFIAVFVGWVVFRGYVSVINHTEQPMDLMFLNAVVTSPHYPPQDPWLAGEPVSYYYFGYLMVGVLTLLSGLATAVTYNLGLASTAALGALAAFGIVYNLVRLSRGSALGAGLAGLGSAFLLLGASNLVGTLQLAQASGIGSEGFWAGVGVDGLSAPAGPSGGWTPGGAVWWWWPAARVIPGAITEFPFFSFLLGDMHPHVMSIPYVLLTLALGLQIYRSPGLLGLAGLRREWPLALAVPVSVGALAAINMWDLPLGLVLVGGAVLLHTVRQGDGPNRTLGSGRAAVVWTIVAAIVFLGLLLFLFRSGEVMIGLGTMEFSALEVLALLAAVLLAVAVLFVLNPRPLRTVVLIAVLAGLAGGLFVPFYVTFESNASFILPLQGILSRPLHLLLVWGVSGSLALAFLAAMRRPILTAAGPWGTRFWLSAAVGFAPVLLWLQPPFVILGYIVALLAFVVHKVGFRWAGFDEAPLAVGSGTSRTVGLLVLAVLLLYDGIANGEQGAGGAYSAISRLMVVMPMALVVTVGIYGAWSLARRQAASASKTIEGSEAVALSDESSSVVLGVLALAGTLIMGAELFYVVDVFGGDLRRMNTVFKLYFQAWLLMSIVGGYSLYYVSRGWDLRQAAGRIGMGVWTVGLVLALGAVLYYPLAAAWSRAGSSSGFGLDGQAYLALAAPAEHRAIQWIRENLPRDVVVVEAAVVPCGDNPLGCGDWTAAGRIAGSTGRPTILGWEQHELQWRSSPERVAGRRDHVREIYETTDVGRAKELLEKYSAEYVVVGSRERSAYGSGGMAKFTAMGTVVFSAGAANAELTIYRLIP
jgi:YYY domain-containing protein